MTAPTDWRALFESYIRHVARMEGTDYLRSAGPDGLAWFKSRLDAAAFAELSALVQRIHAEENADHADSISKSRYSPIT